MQRELIKELHEWQRAVRRKPLLLRGARQVGKTTLVRQFSKSYQNAIEINLEERIDIRNMFEQANQLSAAYIIQRLQILTGIKLNAGDLLFIDEIQESPNALRSLRYFYEQRPDIHVIAAGSLLEFILEEVGMPVGRITSLWLRPLSFVEFIGSAVAEQLLETELLSDSSAYDHYMQLLYEYLAVGGMPEAVQLWFDSRDILQVTGVHREIIETYRQDFLKYSKSHQLKYMTAIFDHVPQSLGERLKLSHIPGEYRKRDLMPALAALEKAGIIMRVMHSHGHGVPLGAQSDPDIFKVCFLDIGLAQAILQLDARAWFVDQQKSLINRGAVIEGFIGQELLAYSDPGLYQQLHFWQRPARSSQAEVDYLISQGSQIIPVEVKAGKSRRIKSLALFCQERPHTSVALRFWAHRYEDSHDKDYRLFSYPLFAVAAGLRHMQDLGEG